MNFKELIQKTSKQTGFSQKDIKTTLQTAFTIMINELMIGNKITFRNLFSITPSPVKGHVIEQKNREILIPTHTRFSFKISKTKKKK